MAQDMVVKIREAESKADEIIENAKKEAKKILADANDTVNNLSNESEKKRENDRKKIINIAQSEAQKKKNEALKKADKEILKISEMADKNRESAVIKAVNFLF